jgi:endonuclease/exonuclease/phosphatase family metal-dependent hydrolase
VGGPSAAAPSTVNRSAAAAVSADIRVASFNVQGISLDRTQGAQRPWKQRRDTIVSQILSGRVDVIGVQETNPSNYYRSRLVRPANINQYFDLRAGLNYFSRDTYAMAAGAPANCVNQMTTYNCVPKDNRASGNDRILYNTRTLRQVDHGATRYSQTSSSRSTAGVAWSRLEVRATGRQFLFTTTHLDPVSRSVRLAQWKQMITIVNGIKGNLPVVATGDFNAHKFDEMAATMLPAMKSAGYGDVLNQQYNVNPSVGVRAQVLSQAWVNSFNHDRADVASYSYDDRRDKTGLSIDYIFASNNLPVKDFKLVLRFDPETLQVSGVLPSDHNMLRATVTIP